MRKRRQFFPDDFIGDILGDKDSTPRFQPTCFLDSVRDAPVKLGFAEIVGHDEQMGAGFIAKVVFLGRAKSATGCDARGGGGEGRLGEFAVNSF